MHHSVVFPVMNGKKTETSYFDSNKQIWKSWRSISYERKPAKILRDNWWLLLFFLAQIRQSPEIFLFRSTSNPKKSRTRAKMELSQKSWQITNNFFRMKTFPLGSWFFEGFDHHICVAPWKWPPFPFFWLTFMHLAKSRFSAAFRRFRYSSVFF